MKQLVIACTGTLLVGSALGYLAGKSSADPSDASTEIVTRVSVRDGGREVVNRTIELRDLETIMRTGGQSERLINLISHFDSLDPDQFAAEADKVGRLPMSERFFVGYLLYSRWGEVAPLDALDHSKSLGFASRFVQPTIVQSWATQDPVSAAQYYAENVRSFSQGRRGRGMDAGAGIAKEWAKQDPEAALAWARSLNSRSGQQAEASVFAEMASGDPEEAARQLAASNDLAGRGMAVERIAAEWGASDFDKARDWANGLPEGERESAMREALEGLASVDYERAAVEVLAMPESDARTSSIATVAEEMSRQDAARAMQWAAENGGEQAQRDAMRQVMPNWASQDSAAALNWLNQQNVGALRDSGAASFVYSNPDMAAETVFEVATTIDDERSRERAVRFAGRQWMSEDPEAARAFLQTAEGISDEQRERMLRD